MSANTVEPIQCLDMDGFRTLSSRLSEIMADNYARNNLHDNTIRKLNEKMVQLWRLYSIPTKMLYMNGEPVECIDLTGENRDLILGLNEEGD